MKPSAAQPVVVLSAAVVAAVAAVDFFTTNYNLSVLYVLPLVMSSRLRRRVPLWAGALLIVLTFAGYFINLSPGAHEGWRGMVVSPRFLNRCMVALVILVVTASSSTLVELRRQFSIRAAAGSQPGDDVVMGLDRLIIGALCMLLILVILGIDLLTPSNFNLPILYAVPILVCPWSGSRGLMWLVVGAVLGFSLAGYFWGPPPLPSPALSNIVTNRTLSSAIVVAIALVLHFVMGADIKRGQPE